MANRMADSMEEKVWMKNICVRQEWNSISLWFRRKTLSTVGRVDKDRPTSVAASIDRKMYWASWRLEAVLIAKRMMQFPRRAVRYMTHNGIEVHICAASSPGMPVRRSIGGWNQLLFMSSIRLFLEIQSRSASKCFDWEKNIHFKIGGRSTSNSSGTELILGILRYQSTDP